MLLRKNIPLGYVFGKIRYEIIAITIYSSLVAVLYYQFDLTSLSIPISIPMIMCTVISLLLGFRSSQAYDRWWEARMIWGEIVNESRTLTRQIFTLGRTDEGNDINHFRQRWVMRQIAWVNALGQSLRGKDPHRNMDKYLSRKEINYISRFSNVPVALLELHGRDLAYALQQGWVNEYQQVEIDKTITRLCDAMGKSERIKNTVFPATYSLYIHLAVNFFLFLLPLSLVGILGVFEVPIVVTIAASFLLIEKMAIHLQDPFENKPTDTPVTTIARNIENDLRQMLNDEAAAPPIVAEKLASHKAQKQYYIL